MITLIAAIDENNLIGKDAGLPWSLPEDLKHFKETTLNHPIVMGRVTYEGLPFRPLPKRTNIVITQRGNIEGAHCFPDIQSALSFGESISEEVFVIGGQSIYEQTIGMADRLLITHVAGTHEGNFFFPVIGIEWWATRVVQQGQGYRITEYKK